MKLKRRILSGGLALAMLAGSFFINSGQASAEDPAPWAPSQADIDFAAAAPTDWAFEVTSVGLHNAILVKYPTIDQAPNGNGDGYISKSEASNWTASIDVTGKGITGTINGIENFINLENDLVLSGNNFTGTIPVNIGNLTKLKIFYLSTNHITGEIPNSITNMAGLKTLALHYNALSGEIPTGIDNLSNLTVLMLSYNQLSGEIPSELGNLANLKELYLGGNKLTGFIPSELGNLTNLTALGLQENELTGSIPVELKNLMNATIFAIYSNQLDINIVEGSDSETIDNITQAKLNLAVNDLENFPPNATYYISLQQDDIDNAQSLLDLKTDAEAAVLDLFDGTNIATGITETEIADAELLVEGLPSQSETYTALTDQIALARQMLVAKTAADALLTIAPDNTNLAGGITQDDITAAQDLVTDLDDITAGDLKVELQAKIDIAQNLLDAEGLVGALLVDNKTALATGVTQGAIDAAKTAVEALPTGDTQDALLADIATAQGLLDAKTLADAKTTAKAELDQKATDANNAIDALPNLTDSEKAAAKDAVNNALTDAKDAVDLATTPTNVGAEKDSGITKINEEVTKAEVLDALNAAKAVAKADLDQKAIDAKNVINSLPNLTDAEKVTEINKVDTDLSNAKTAVDVAGDITAVNNAKNSGDTNITNDLNDAKALDAANLADAKTAAKAELVAKAEAVKNEIDGLTNLSTTEKATAKEAVEAELTRGSNAIDAATTVAKVTEEKTTSIANMDKLLKDAKALDAKNAVANLFDEKGTIKEDVNQDVINNAKAKVEGLDPGAEKDLLTILIAEAQKQLDAKNSVDPAEEKPVASVTSTKTIGNINTGDDTNIIFYVAGMLLALIGLGFVVRRKIIKQS